MVSMVHYVQHCPVCGRPAQVRVAHLGRQVTCTHCRGEFIADHRQQDSVETNDLLRRADELLRRAAQRQQCLASGANPWIGL